MTEGRTRQDFMEFLDWLGDKGILPLNTAQARKAVANKVLAALEEEELADITALDIDDVMHRFINKFGKNYKPDSQRTYRSRFETSVADFRAYCADPVGFRPGGRSPVRRGKEDEAEPKSPKRSAVRKREPVGGHDARGAPATDVGASVTGNVVPVQIRSDLTVRIGPVPYDLTAIEARRIANVILALAMPES